MATLESMIEWCDHCQSELELGQIGLCGNCQDSEVNVDLPSRLNDKAVKKFASETCLLPVMFVDQVAAELLPHLDASPNKDEIIEYFLSDALVDVVEQRACSLYSQNAKFRRQCRTGDPRSLFLSFVRLWVSSAIGRQFPRLRTMLPVSFSVGIGSPLPTKVAFS